MVGPGAFQLSRDLSLDVLTCTMYSQSLSRPVYTPHIYLKNSSSIPRWQAASFVPTMQGLLELLSNAIAVATDTRRKPLITTPELTQNKERYNVEGFQTSVAQRRGQRTLTKYFCAHVHTKTDSSEAQDLTAIATRRGRVAGIIIPKYISPGAGR